MTGTNLQADLCIVGAGIAGLNALWVASQYLGPDQHVVLVDRHEKPGGMWVDTYDYVRLHQPHPFFTTGNEPWTLGAPKAHLASKTEVLSHLQHCLDSARKRVRVTELFGHEYVGAEESATGVTISCRATDGSWVYLEVDHLIDAGGLSIESLQPFELSSDRVRSVSPETCDVRTGPIGQDDAPVWVIGSGKTGMDTADALITQQPGREVNLLAGTGTFFANRDLMYPHGIRRYWQGVRPNTIFLEMADRFDGTNEAELLDWARARFGVWATPTAEHFFYGTISPAEIERIRAGLRQVYMDHLVDAVDQGDAVRLELRSGEHIAVQPGTWVVNCTSHFAFAGRPTPAPYVSPGGRIVTIGISALFGFTSFTGYFLTHLLYLGKITRVPLYEIDLRALIEVSQPAMVGCVPTMIQYNLGLVFDNVPSKVFQQFGLDYDRWYPLPRQLAGQLRFMAGHKKKRAQYRRALDTVGERFGVRVGPVIGSGMMSA